MPIFDQGYQHWNGALSSHAWRWLAVTRHGVRVGLKNRWLRYVLFAAWVPALALVVAICLWGLLERKSGTVATLLQFLKSIHPDLVTDPVHYRPAIWRLAYHYFLQTELYFSMILILLVGPSLISLDLRFNALPLYFSRPLRRIDYFVGKLGVVTVFLSMVMILPAVAAYVLGLLFSFDLTIIRDTTGILLGSVAYGLVIAFSAGALVLTMSALSRNSRYVALFWVGLWIVSAITSTVLQGINNDQRRHAYYRQMSVQPPRFAGGEHAPTRDEQARQWQEFHRVRQAAEEDYHQAEFQHSKTDWRPLVSYTANLSRLGQALLGTDASWKDLAKLQPLPRDREVFLATYMGPQYPWLWSAGILAALAGLSACILNRSVRSLDRLK